MTAKTVAKVMPDIDGRVATGVPGLDDLLEGGFPTGSLITLAGRPGTGKTIFGSQFLYQGARENAEPGMYVSMLEGRKAYFRNMNRPGLDLLSPQKENPMRFLFMTARWAAELADIRG